MNTPDAAVAFACLTAGGLYGLLGSMAFLRRQSLRGDVLAHGAWPGVLLAFALTGQRSPAILGLGALVSALGMNYLISFLERQFPRLKGDAAPALLLSGSFAVASVIWSLMQSHTEGLGQAGLKSFLLGQAASVQWQDTWSLILVFALATLSVLFFWRDLPGVLFDRDQAIIQGRPVKMIEWLLELLLAIAVVTGLTIVGVVVLSALFVAIPLAVRPFTHRFGPFLLASTLLGTMIGMATPWIVISLESGFGNSGRGIPTGPIFVLAASLLAFTSLLVAHFFARKSPKELPTP